MDRGEGVDLLHFGGWGWIANTHKSTSPLANLSKKHIVVVLVKQEPCRGQRPSPLRAGAWGGVLAASMHGRGLETSGAG